MIKKYLFLIIMFGLFSMGSKTYAEIAYNFKFNGIDGKQINLADYENNVLVLEIDKFGLLKKKDFYNKDDMNDIKFTKNVTGKDIRKKNFVYSFMSSLRQKINDPLDERAKKRKEISQR